MRHPVASSSTTRRHLRLRPLALSLACIGAVAPAWSQINAGPGAVGGFPQVGNVVAGTVRGAFTNATTLSIDQSSWRAIINWNAFSLSGGNTVNFNQAMGPGSVTLNRVVNGGPRSDIFGAINAPGHVFIINPAGVLFGSGSQVNVGGLVASTLDIADSQIISGDKADRPLGASLESLAFSGDAASTARVMVEDKASITTTAPGGTVALVGALVRNEGSINVAQGSAGLVSGSKVTLDFMGDGLTQFKVPVDGLASFKLAEVRDNKSDPLGASTTAQVMNSGTVQADGGRVVLVGASNVAQRVVNHSGTVRAQSLSTRGGEIVLEAVGPANGGQVLQVSGALDASSAQDGVAGGRIRTTGDRLLVSGATIDAGGGIGGANGQWVAEGGIELAVTAKAPALDTTPTRGEIDASTVGGALTRGTDVTLIAREVSDRRLVLGAGVFFEAGAKVHSEGLRPATLRVDSVGNIDMGQGAEISASRAALNVAFNADAQGLAAPDAGRPDNTAAAIRLTGATIDANGGDIRFFGQNKVDGSAIGGIVKGPVGDVTETLRSGIWLSDSTLGTRGAGSISLAGSGGINSSADSSSGVEITGTSALRTEAGNIALRGAGGAGGGGVVLRGGASGGGEEQAAYSLSLTSTGGDIRIAGRTRDWTTGDPLQTLSSSAGSVGVAMDRTTIRAAGDVNIVGEGGDLSGLRAISSSLSTSVSVGASSGVRIADSRVEAGAGRRIDVSGTAGSQGFSVGPAGVQEGDAPFAVTVASSRNTDALHTAGGRIGIAAGAGDVGFNVGAAGPGLLDVSNPAGQGGDIAIAGRNILAEANARLLGVAPLAVFDLANANGRDGGGQIDIHGVTAAGQPDSGIVAIGANVALRSNALEAGNGGSIRVVGDRTLRAHGAFEAKGGSQGGNGGTVETSGAAFDLSGVRVSASAPVGTAGSWTIDPYDVAIVHGNAAGSLGSNPFIALATSTIQDGDINAALNAGSDVTIATTQKSGGTQAGDITMFGGVDIHYNQTTTGARTLTLNATNSVRSDAQAVIAAAGDGRTLNVVFNADAENGGTATGGGQVSYSGSIYTNGGSVTMRGAAANPSATVSVALDGQAIDTRGGNTQTANPSDPTRFVNVGGNDAQAGGNVDIAGRTAYSTTSNAFNGVLINGTSIRTGTGNIDILGTTDNGSGVIIQSAQGQGGLFTTSGNVNVTGVGGYASSGPFAPGYGVVIGAPPFNASGQPRISSVDGNIAVRGLRQAGAGTGAGVRVGGNAQILTSGQGAIEVTGQTQGNGSGVELAPTFSDTFGTQQGGVIAGARNVVLRAANDGSTDALVLGAGSQASAGAVMNLRPGGMNLSGTPDAYVATAVDRPANAVTIGGASATGFAVSAAELTRIAAPTLVFGSDAHAADITVVGALNMSSALTLQNGGGGNIALNAPVTTPTLGLISGGNITQTAAAPITAGTLLAASSGGSVLLDQAANNVSAATLGGGAAGAFRYQDVDALRIGNVSVTGYGAAGNQPQVVATGSMVADTVFVRTLTGDLTLATNVSSTSGTDLVAAARFQNAGAFTISGAPWRVWADTWVGETRGGMTGSGGTPNLYGCVYLGGCGVTITPGDNHFIYAQRPRATVTIGDATRPVGTANPPFGYAVSGLILDDTAAGFTGTPGTSADASSPEGAYAITGSFLSAAGYAVDVVPGTLTVSAAPPPPPPATPRFRLPEFQSADLVRELPDTNTYTFDRNIGAPPICFATGPLGGDRAQQGDDLLAREWSRVRSRPKLTSCIDTEQKNGCADF